MSHRACVLLAIRGARAHCSPGAPRQVLGWHLLRDRWGLHAALGIEAPVLRAWLAFVASAYGAGALYHSATHAADVLQSVHFVLLVNPPPPPPPPPASGPKERGRRRRTGQSGRICGDCPTRIRPDCPAAPTDDARRRGWCVSALRLRAEARGPVQPVNGDPSPRNRPPAGGRPPSLISRPRLPALNRGSVVRPVARGGGRSVGMRDDLPLQTPTDMIKANLVRSFTIRCNWYRRGRGRCWTTCRC